jgi:hypothetical protein
MIYQGATTSLIIQPQDAYTVAPNGLITLARSYCCATTYADTAAASLSVGSVPSGYSTLSLFTKTRKDSSGITTFDCQYYGASGGQKIGKSQQFRSYDLVLTDSAQTKVSGKYLSPTWVIEKAVAQNADTISEPTESEMGAVVIFSYYANGIPGAGDSVTLGTYVDLVSTNRTNYGAVDVFSKTYQLVSSKG